LSWKPHRALGTRLVVLAERVLERGEGALVRASGPLQHRLGDPGAQQLQKSSVVVQPDPKAAGSLLRTPAMVHHHPEQDQQPLVERRRSRSVRLTS
jgi:hypothetical protein